MRIGIDISQIVFTGSGVARYTHGLVRAILKYNTTDNWHFFFSSLRRQLDPELVHAIRTKGHTITSYPYPPTLISYVNNSLHPISHLLPTAFHSNKKLDWFITSDWSEPRMPGVKKCTIVHDLVFKRFPETLHQTILHTQQKRLEHVAREADLIIAVSESTADDLKHFYPIKPERIVVNYTGISDFATQRNNSNEILNAYELHKPYILTVGKREPRKNLELLVEAFKKSETTAQLVIVGDKGWGAQNSKQESDRIKFLGYVPDSDLSDLYREALFFIYPSLYEGFGYPILEAMKLKCPVATSNTSSLRELGHGHAYMFDPHERASITDAINSMFHDEELRGSHIEKAKKFADSFTWERYYTKLITELRERK